MSEKKILMINEELIEKYINLPKLTESMKIKGTLMSPEKMEQIWYDVEEYVKKLAILYESDFTSNVDVISLYDKINNMKSITDFTWSKFILPEEQEFLNSLYPELTIDKYKLKLFKYKIFATNYYYGTKELNVALTNFRKNANILYIILVYNSVEYSIFKAKNTLKKHGVVNISQLNEIKSKVKNTYKEKYGVEHIMQLPGIKEKIKETNLQKYGVEWAAQAEEVKEKIKETNLKKYGVEYAGQAKEIVEKRQETIRKKYNVEKSIWELEEFREKRKKTNIKKYGTENPSQSEIVKQKIKETNLKKYGATNPMKNLEMRKRYEEKMLEKHGYKYPFQSKEVHEKAEKTFQEKLGVKRPFQSKEIQNKVKKTTKEKYHVDVISQHPEIKEKIKQTNKKRYGQTNVMFNEEIYKKAIVNKQKSIFEKYKKMYIEWLNDLNLEIIGGIDKLLESRLNRSTLDIKCNNCEQVYTLKSEETHNFAIDRIKCPVCHNFDTASFEEKIFRNKLLQHLPQNISVEFNKRFYYDSHHFYELDIFFPEYNLGIEYNGIYWHSEQAFENNNKFRHYKKYKFFKEKNIDVIFLTSFDVMFNFDIVLSIIKNRLGLNSKIYARKTIVEKVDYKVAEQFIEENHIKGKVRAMSYYLGLYYQDELVALIGLKKLPKEYQERYKCQYELSIFVIKKHYSIIGGFSKLLKHIPKDYFPILSYVDMDYFNGKGYEKVGFQYIGETEPSYYWFSIYQPELRFSRNQTQKHKLAKFFNIDDPELLNLSEKDFMESLGFVRYWTVGNKIYKLFH